MVKRSKKYREAAERVDRNNLVARRLPRLPRLAPTSSVMTT